MDDDRELKALRKLEDVSVQMEKLKDLLCMILQDKLDIPVDLTDKNSLWECAESVKDIRLLISQELYLLDYQYKDLKNFIDTAYALRK